MRFLTRHFQITIFNWTDRDILTRVGVKYSWPSTQVPQIYTKFKYWSSTHFFKKYLSTSSTFISSTSTSTSTHIKICSKVRMDIQSKVNFGWTKYRAFPKSCLLKSRWPYSMQSRFWVDKLMGLFQKSCFVQISRSIDGHILCRINLEWTKYRGVI